MSKCEKSAILSNFRNFLLFSLLLHTGRLCARFLLLSSLSPFLRRFGSALVVSLIFSGYEWNHRILCPGDGEVSRKSRHISIGYNRYMPARDYMKSLSKEGTSLKMRAMSFGIKSCGRRLNVSPFSSRSWIVVCNCVLNSLLKIVTSLSLRQ